MATLPADRTKLALAQSNQNPQNVLGSSQNKNALTEAYDTIDLLYNNMTGLISAAQLSKLGIINVKDYNASGSAQSTTGSITAGSNILTLSTALDFANGQGINVNGKTEVDSLQITAAATVSSNVTVTLNGVAFPVAVLAGDTIAQVATKIRAATYAGWTTGGTNDTITFTSTTTGARTTPVYSAGTTTAIGTMKVTTLGSADLITVISSGAGTTTLTLSVNATTTVSSVTVAHDDTVAIQNAINSLGVNGGIILFPPGTCTTTSALIISKNGTQLIGSGRAASIISNSASNVFTLADGIRNLNFQSFTVSSSGGIIFAPLGVISLSRLYDLSLNVLSPTGYIWYQNMGTMQYIDMLVEHCDLSCVSTAIVSPWYQKGANGGINSNSWRRLRVTANNASVPFFYIEEALSGNFCYDNNFEGITGEICSGGILKIMSPKNLTMINVMNYDTVTYSGAIVSVGKTTAATSDSVLLIGVGRRGGTLGSGVFDILIDSNTTQVVLISCNPSPGNGSFSVPTGQTSMFATGASPTGATSIINAPYIFSAFSSFPNVEISPMYPPAGIGLKISAGATGFPAAAEFFSIWEYGDTFSRVKVNAKGVWSFGSGAAAHDLTIQRIAPGSLSINAAVQTKTTTTAARPAANAVGAGAQVYDTTLSIPIWTDGTNWRNAAGTIV